MHRWYDTQLSKAFSHTQIFHLPNPLPLLPPSPYRTPSPTAPLPQLSPFSTYLLPEALTLRTALTSLVLTPCVRPASVKVNLSYLFIHSFFSRLLFCTKQRQILDFLFSPPPPTQIQHTYSTYFIFFFGIVLCRNLHFIYLFLLGFFIGSLLKIYILYIVKAADSFKMMKFMHFIMIQILSSRTYAHTSNYIYI